MNRALTVQAAEIRTAAVEIKTLTVSGKQVTLAVFRQLREKPLIAEDGALNGIPWGIVNYHPEKCAYDRPAHWHIVWQDGSELLRSTVAHYPAFGRFRVSTPLMSVLYLQSWLREPIDPSVSNIDWRCSYCDATVDGVTIPCLFGDLDFDEGVAPILSHRFENLQSDWGVSQIAKVKASLTRRADQIDTLLAHHKEQVLAEIERRRRWEKTTEALTALPQLFIAV
jgi:hypothetical protein